MTEEKRVEVGAVDVDFTANLGERDDVLVAVVLPCFGRDSEQFSSGFGFYPVGVSFIGVAVRNEFGKTVAILSLPDTKCIEEGVGEVGGLETDDVGVREGTVDEVDAAVPADAFVDDGAVHF